MLTKKRIFGDVGENIAKTFLLKLGFTVIESNFYTKFGEIDIVCSKINKEGIKELFFVEVKTRTGFNKNTYPEDAVNYNKRIKMDRAAQIYLEKNKINNIFYSFSCVAIVIDKKDNKIDIKFFEKI